MALELIPITILVTVFLAVLGWIKTDTWKNRENHLSTLNLISQLKDSINDQFTRTREKQQEDIDDVQKEISCISRRMMSIEFKQDSHVREHHHYYNGGPRDNAKPGGDD